MNKKVTITNANGQSVIADIVTVFKLKDLDKNALIQILIEPKNSLVKQYQKLLSKANLDVEYMYLLSDWFRNEKYKDVLDYIHSVRCHYYFEYIPLTRLGLPVPETEGE